MHFAITIDTEVDKSRDWSVASDAGFEGVRRGVQCILHPLFSEYGVSPVYFLSNEVLVNDELCSFFKDCQTSNKAELGTHLHYEAAGPLAVGHIAGRKLDGVQAQLNENDERLALAWLTDIYKQKFAKNPVSFRAGRYGLSRNSISLLAELGYKVDSSVTPGLMWEYTDGVNQFVADYRRAPMMPYECAANCPSEVGNSGILQIPITLQKSSLSVREIARLSIGKRRRWIWLRPMFASKRELLKIIKTVAERKSSSDILVMMFHNMEVIPGKSPYCSTEEDATRYLDALVYFIEQAQANGIVPITLEGYARKFYNRLF